MSTVDVRRTAIVTGAGRGIGLAIAERLAADGHRVVLVDLDGDAVVRAAERMPAALGVCADVTRQEDVDSTLRDVTAWGGPIGILVNNAGIPSQAGPIEDQSDAHWERALDVMLTAPFRWCRAVIPLMKQAGWGRIVNVASVAGKEGNAFSIPYSCAKAGVICLTKALAREVATHGILVNAVAPAVIETDLIRSVPWEVMEPLVAKIPMGRIGRPQEVAAGVSFLASEQASFTTGQTLDLSGGRCTY